MFGHLVLVAWFEILVWAIGLRHQLRFETLFGFIHSLIKRNQDLVTLHLSVSDSIQILILPRPLFHSNGRLIVYPPARSFVRLILQNLIQEYPSRRPTQIIDCLNVGKNKKSVIEFCKYGVLNSLIFLNEFTPVY